MCATTKRFAEEFRQDVKYYRERAKASKSNGLHGVRAFMLKQALFNRANARKWAAYD